MTKQKLSKELKNNGIEFDKIIFHKESPYQKRRYKPEYVGWEAWVYKHNAPTGFLITQEGWECEEYKYTILSTL